MSDSDKDSESGSGSGSGSDNSGSDDNDSGSGSGSGSDSGSGSGSGSGSDSGSKSGSDSGSDSGSSDSGKKKKKGKKGKMNAIDDLNKPKVGMFFELQSIMRSILMDLNGIESKTKELEMRFNPKPFVMPPSPPKQPVKRAPSPTRNYFPPGYTGGQVHFDDEENQHGILKQHSSPGQHQIVLQPSMTAPAESEYGGTASHYSHGRASSAHNQYSVENLPMAMQTPVPYPMTQQSARHASMPRAPYQIQQVLPPNFGVTGPYTKYLKTAQNPEPQYTNRFFQHQPMQMKPMTSRFANASSPAQQPNNRNYSDVHNNQQPQYQSGAASSRPPMHTQRSASLGFQQATTMQDHANNVPQSAIDMMQLQQMRQSASYRAGAQSVTGTESQETARQQQYPDQYNNHEKKMSAGPPPGVGNAVQRVQLAQIENAIDCLLAQ